jgi:hypothetical protein
MSGAQQRLEILKTFLQACGRLGNKPNAAIGLSPHACETPPLDAPVFP